MIREGLTLTVLGLGLGVLGSVLITRLLAGLPTWDPVTYLGAVALLAIIAVAACWVPARWASRVSPVEALSSE